MKFKDTVELGLLYVGVPALTLYPLGFVGLGIELWRDPFFPYYDFLGVYNAVALVPNTVVAGTGVKLLYLSVISTLIGAVFASLTFRLIAARSKREESESPRGRAGAWSFLLLVLLPVAAILTYYQVTVEGWDDAPYVAGFLVFSIAGAYLPAARVSGTA